MNRLIGLFLFLLAGFLVEPITWGFSLNRHRLPPLSLKSFGIFPPHLHGQTWILTAEGGQSFVFMSESGTHILKLFKDQPRPWLKLPSYEAQKNKKLDRTLTGYTLIQERCPALSAALCLHTQPSTPIPATLIDRLKIAHPVDLSSYLFVLQQKADSLQPPQSPEEKQALFLETSRLVQTLAECRLKDHDHRLHLNLGKIGSHLIVIDPGKISEGTDPSPHLPAKFLEFIQ
jgi:hypothetical protein